MWQVISVSPLVVHDLSYFIWVFLLGSCHCYESQSRGATGGSDLPQSGHDPFYWSRAPSQWWVYSQTEARPEWLTQETNYRVWLSHCLFYMTGSLRWHYRKQPRKSFFVGRVQACSQFEDKCKMKGSYTAHLEMKQLSAFWSFCWKWKFSKPGIPSNCCYGWIVSVYFHFAVLDAAGQYFEQSLSAYRSSVGLQDPAFLSAQDDFCRFLLINGQQEVKQFL